MKRVATAVLAGVVAVGFATVAEAGCGQCGSGEHPGHRKQAKTEVTGQTTCPVMGGKINKDLYVDHDGKRIYVCCPGCIGKIKADPDAYIKELTKEGVALDAAPKEE